MKNHKLFGAVFGIIFLSNLGLTIWNYLQGDLMEAAISGVIVFLILLMIAIKHYKKS